MTNGGGAPGRAPRIDRLTTMFQTQTVLSALVVLAGAGIPIMAALNASLASHLGSSLGAALILSLIASVFAWMLFLLNEGRCFPAIDGLSPVHVFPGLLFIAYLSTVTFAAPRLGLGNAIVLVLLGQLTSSAIVDQFALFGAAQTSLSWRRLLGLSLIVLGAYVSISAAPDVIRRGSQPQQPDSSQPSRQSSVDRS